MSGFHKRSKDAMKRALKWGAIGTLTAQVLAVSAVVAIDENRKRRNPPSGEFPHMDPQDAPIADSTVRVYTFGGHLFKEMLEAINTAEKYIFFETYIIKADDVGYAFRDALIAAAERGVKVYIILDTFGNLNQDPRFRRFPNHENLHVIRFPLIRPWFLTARSKDSGYDHRKILCVDSEVGFVGGYNIGRLYADHWRDTHIRISGPRVWELENAFVDMWNVYRSGGQPELPDEGSKTWTSQLRAIQNIPAFRSYPVRAKYLEAINRADSRIWITMGYFIPDFGIMHSLTSAAKRGVDVRILIPQYSNHIVADWVSRPHYSELLNAGARIFLYEEAMVHAKTMTVDGIWSTVGTTNIDRLSMAGNFEINVEIFDRDMAKTMEEIFQMDMSNAHELLSEDWENRSALARIAERVLKPLAPLL